MEEDEDAGEETKFEVEEQKSIETLKNENLYRISWQVLDEITLNIFAIVNSLIIK
jgi:hypothetical protein